MNKPLVSIIIPVYNAQKCIAQCIESVLSQTYDNFELILMDDGSKDESGNICDEYANKDSRIQVIHKENSGVSDTRNQALGLARGEYLQFVDADDWLTVNATETLVNAMMENNCELVISNFYRVVDNKVSSKGSIDYEGVLSLKDFALHLMESPADFYYGVLWNKLYKKSIIDEYQLNMDPKISLCEDFIFNLRYLAHIQNIYVSQVPIYYYVKTKNSLVSQSFSFEKIVQMKTMVFDHYYQFFKAVFDEDEYKKNRLSIYRFLIDVADDGLSLPFIDSKDVINKEIDTTIEENYFEMNIMNKLVNICYSDLCQEYKLNAIEIQILLYLYKNHYLTHQALSNQLGCSIQKIMLSLHNLKSKDLITWNEVKVVNEKTEKRLEYHLLSNALIVVEKAKTAQNEFYMKCFDNFTSEEIDMYQKLNNKLKDNIAKLTYEKGA